MSTAPHGIAAPLEHEPGGEPELRIYGHSSFFYWWPVWLLGYVMALITRFQGVQVQIGGVPEWFYPGRNLGVIFTMVLFFIILLTNVSFRGLASAVLILAVLFITVLFAYLGWWDVILSWIPYLSIHMNMGFFILFSTLIFIIWASSVFIYDRMSYWLIRPGQITHEYVIGGAEKSYDTRGMVFEKNRQDLFRHWLLGLGSADLVISTTGARNETLIVPNVLFVDAKVNEIQKMIAVRPDKFLEPPTA